MASSSSELWSPAIHRRFFSETRKSRAYEQLLAAHFAAVQIVNELPHSKGWASDGGDVGCRYTPEKIEMLKLALDLRARGIIDF